MRRLEESQEPIAFKVDAVAPSDHAVSGASGGDGGAVAFRVDIRSLAGMQKEALVCLVAPAEKSGTCGLRRFRIEAFRSQSETR